MFSTSRAVCRRQARKKVPGFPQTILSGCPEKGFCQTAGDGPGKHIYSFAPDSRQCRFYQYKHGSRCGFHERSECRWAAASYFVPPEYCCPCICARMSFILCRGSPLWRPPLGPAKPADLWEARAGTRYRSTGRTGCCCRGWQTGSSRRSRASRRRV